MENSSLFETALVHVCMYVCMYGPFWSYFFALHGQTYIHTYKLLFTFLMFFWRFCLKTWPWPWKYYFWGSQKRNWRVVKMFVWMYVCMFAHAGRGNGRRQPQAAPGSLRQPQAAPGSPRQLQAALGSSGASQNQPCTILLKSIPNLSKSYVNR